MLLLHFLDSGPTSSVPLSSGLSCQLYDFKLGPQWVLDYCYSYPTGFLGVHLPIHSLQSCQKDLSKMQFPPHHSPT